MGTNNWNTPREPNIRELEFVSEHKVNMKGLSTDELLIIRNQPTRQLKLTLFCKTIQAWCDDLAQEFGKLAGLGQAESDFHPVVAGKNMCLFKSFSDIFDDLQQPLSGSGGRTLGEDLIDRISVGSITSTIHFKQTPDQLLVKLFSLIRRNKPIPNLSSNYSVNGVQVVAGNGSKRSNSQRGDLVFYFKGVGINKTACQEPVYRARKGGKGKGKKPKPTNLKAVPAALNPNVLPVGPAYGFPPFNPNTPNYPQNSGTSHNLNPGERAAPYGSIGANNGGFVTPNVQRNSQTGLMGGPSGSKAGLNAVAESTTGASASASSSNSSSE
jgi:hypothetical protein